MQTFIGIIVILLGIDVCFALALFALMLFNKEELLHTKPTLFVILQQLKHVNGYVLLMFIILIETILAAYLYKHYLLDV